MTLNDRMVVGTIAANSAVVSANPWWAHFILVAALGVAFGFLWNLWASK